MQNIFEFLVNSTKKKSTKPELDEDVVQEIQKYMDSGFWKFNFPEYDSCKCNINVDKNGYYIETDGDARYQSGYLDMKNIEDIFDKEIDRYNNILSAQCPKFRWKSHKGKIVFTDLQKLRSIKGLPTESEIEFLVISGFTSGKVDLGNLKIKKLRIYNTGDIKLVGNPQIDEIEYMGYNGKKPEITFKCSNIHKA